MKVMQMHFTGGTFTRGRQTWTGRTRSQSQQLTPDREIHEATGIRTSSDRSKNHLDLFKDESELDQYMQNLWP